MLVSAVVSWIVVRTRMPGRWILDNLASLPLVFPGLVVFATEKVIGESLDDQKHRKLIDRAISEVTSGDRGR